MITSVAEQWALSAVFVLIAGYAVFGVVGSRTVRDRVAYALHVLMGLAMFTMVWPWGMGLLLVQQAVLFGGAAFWFLLLLALHRRRSPERGVAASGHHDGPGAIAYHAGMMAAMAAMAFAMIRLSTPEVMATAAHDGSRLASMDMSANTAMVVSSPVWVTVISIVFAAGFAIAALYFLGTALSGIAVATTALDRARRADAVWNLLMAVGMVALFLPMIA
jgi:hypothetical protein